MRADYADAHRVAVAGHTDAITAERWLRELLERSALWFRYGAYPGWLLLGLRLAHSRASDNVLGWTITQNTPERILVSARSRTGMPMELGLARDATGWSFTTLVQFENRAVRSVWRLIAPAHRLVLRHLMRAAVARVASSRGSALA